MNTIIIAQVLGFFFAFVGISMVTNRKNTVAVIEASIQNKAVLWLWGFLATLIGATIVVLNNVWTSGLPLLVTVLGWIALIKGAFILFFPNATVSLYRKFNKVNTIVFFGIIAFLLGLVLFYW